MEKFRIFDSIFEISFAVLVLRESPILANQNIDVTSSVYQGGLEARNKKENLDDLART